MLNNGYLRIESNYWDGSNSNVLPTVQSSSSAMYKIGWNLVWYADNGSNFFLYGFPNFATPAVSYSAANTGYTSESYFSSTFAGEFSSGSVINSYQGIIHTIYIKSSYYSSTQAASNFLQKIIKKTLIDNKNSNFVLLHYYLVCSFAFNFFQNLHLNWISLVLKMR